jgi:hypothetical protein
LVLLLFFGTWAVKDVPVRGHFFVDLSPQPVNIARLAASRAN